MAVVYGTPGNDEILDDYPGRTTGADLVFAGEGTDTLKGVEGPDTLYGEGGTDYIILAYDDSGGTTFAAGYGGDGDDFLGGGGRIVLSGGAGSDTLAGVATSGDSVYDGDDGVDWAVGFVPIVLGSPDAYVIDLSNANPDAIEYINVENIRGDELGDALTGDFRANTILGEEGADTIQGGAGADFLDGGTDPGPEEFQKIDTVTYAGAASGVTVQINGAGTRGDAAGDVLINFDVLVGSEFGDELMSDGGNRTINGLGGADTITGGAGADTLDGGAANDDLDGAAGGDSLIGGLGFDTLKGGAGDDVLSGGDSRDLLDGGGDADRLFGDAAADTLRGGAGADNLDGGAGADSMAGGAGDDRYVVDSAGDTVNEAAGGSGGVDTVAASVSFSLSGPRVLGAVENVSLALTGGAIDATGNGLGNRLTGNLYANVLNGMAGADTMQGLGGDDTYYVDRPADVVIEAPGGGYDRVFAASRYTLAAGEEIELLAATGAAATNGVTLVGNAFSQSIRGGSGDDVLNAAGGVDTLRGYEGDDHYVVNGADVIVEAANAGFDTLEAYQSYALAAGVSIERMQLTAGTSLTGNAFSQTLVGNAGSNRLDGGGGADRMEGGKGGDTYVVDNAGDVVSEAGGNGDDTVETTVSFSLAGARTIGAVENLVLRGGAAINGVGNELSNEIEGNDRANTLTGAGGADTLVGGAGSDRLNGGDGKDWLFGDQGADTMIGGAGADRFYFSFAPGAGGLDTITDFAAGSDTIYLFAGAFGAIGRNAGLGALRPETFRVGAAAADADDRVIYNPANGALLFDADGAGGAAALHFADLDKGLNLNALDFFVF